jgi:hypothetical protein
MLPAVRRRGECRSGGGEQYEFPHIYYYCNNAAAVTPAARG